MLSDAIVFLPLGIVNPSLNVCLFFLFIDKEKEDKLFDVSIIATGLSYSIELFIVKLTG